VSPNSEKMSTASRADRELRLLPPPRRGVSAGRHRSLGIDHQRDPVNRRPDAFRRLLSETTHESKGFSSLSRLRC
jgi:hypothetical protein